MKGPEKERFAPLMAIPGIGEKLGRMLYDLGYRTVSDLKGADPEEMYGKLMKLYGHPIDRCVLYVFRCAVYYASNTRHEAEKLRWWWWKDKWHK